ncbi:MAG: DDE-type integrase/transposase/recombinase [Nitrososphaeria archaeon]
MEKVNGREVYVWATIDVDTRELPAIEATRSRSSTDALLFLSRALGACKNEPAFVVDRGPWCSWALRGLGLEHYHETFGDRSGVERSFGSLKRRTSAFFQGHKRGEVEDGIPGQVMNMSFV